MALVAVASAGFVTSTWKTLADPAQALLLLTGAAVLTLIALWFENLERRGLQNVIGLVMLAATSLSAAGATLATASVAPGQGRVAILVGGAIALAHAVTLLHHRRGSSPLLIGAWAAAVYAAGPVGNSIADRWTGDLLDLVGRPVAGFFDPTISSDAHLAPGVGHLLVGVALVAALHLLEGRALVVGRVLTIFTLGYAALELNVLDNPIGAVGALAIVIGSALVGLWNEDLSLVVAGVIGGFAAGVRVLVAVFTGKVLVTVALLIGGLALLAWAIHAMRQRDEEQAVPAREI